MDVAALERAYLVLRDLGQRRPDASSPPVLQAQATYPFVRLRQAAEERLAQGLEVIDPGWAILEPTDPAIIQALRDGVRERMGYLAAVGLPELREAVARWVDRRFGVELDPDAR